HPRILPSFPTRRSSDLYLNAVKAAGTDDPDAVRAELGKMKIDDFFAKGGSIREDGLLMHPMYLLTVKSGGEDPWDIAEVTHTIPDRKSTRLNSSHVKIS